MENNKRKDEKKADLHIVLHLPDGTLFSLPIFDGENIGEKIKGYEKKWRKLTSLHPERFHHKISKYVCPKCGSEMHFREVDGYEYIWCIKCDYKNKE